MSSSAFSFPLIQLLCQELEKRVLNFEVIDCFPNEKARFSFVLQKQQQREMLFFCLTPPFIRFHFIQNTTVPRVHSSHPLLAFLKGAFLKKASVLQQDRILQLTFQTAQGERLFIVEFFSKHPNYYLLDSDYKILFTLHDSLKTHYQLPTSPIKLSTTAPLWTSHREVEQTYAELEKQAFFNKEKQALKTQLAKQAKKWQKKKHELIDNLAQCAQWEMIQHEGELIKFHFHAIKKGMTSLTLQDWITDQPYHLLLDPTQNPQEQMKTRFKRAKKLQMGVKPLSRYLEHVQIELLRIEELLKQLDEIKTTEELLSFQSQFAFSIPKNRQTSSVTPSTPSVYKEYQSAKGLKIWVGKNAKANDQLTFQLANGRDWWLHAKGCSGSHVVIRTFKDQEPDDETLKDAMQLALYHSKARTQGECEVCFTQRKYVSRLGKGKAGLVQISKHRTAWIRFDPDRYQTLQERSKPFNSNY